MNSFQSEPLTKPIINPIFEVCEEASGGQIRNHKSTIMAITYKITKVKNPKGQEGTVYCHAVAVKTSNYEFDELAEDIASLSSP